MRVTSHVKNITDTHNNNTCDMYKSSLRHIHDPVLSSLKMKGIRLLFNLQYHGFVLSFTCIFSRCCLLYASVNKNQLNA
jgi:hypothetical protein